MFRKKNKIGINEKILSLEFLLFTLLIFLEKKKMLKKEDFGEIWKELETEGYLEKKGEFLRSFNESLEEILKS